MDANEYLERVGADHDSQPESWERDRLTDRDWRALRRGQPPKVLAVPWDTRLDHSDPWRTV